MKENRMLEYNLKLNQEYFITHNTDETEWNLQRNKFCIYEIMNSDNNTEEELKQFVKEHKTYNYTIVMGISSIIICFFVLMLSFINTKLHLVEIRFFVCGAWFILLIEMLLRTLVNSHNNKIKDKIFKEDMKFIKKRAKEIQEKMEEMNDKKRNISKDKKNK